MKVSSLKNVFPVSGKAISRYTRDANANVFNASGAGFDASDSNFYATGGASSTQEPYQIKVKNTNVAAKTAVIFGAFRHLNAVNFGSGEDTAVTMADTSISYAQMLQQSMAEPFEVVLTRIECSDAEQLRTPMLLRSQNSSGDTNGRSITVSSYNSPDQFQSNLIDVQQSFRIDGSTWLEYNMKPGASVSFSFFVGAKVNIAKPLSGQAPVEEFTAQRVRTHN